MVNQHQLFEKQQPVPAKLTRQHSRFHQSINDNTSVLHKNIQEMEIGVTPSMVEGWGRQNGVHDVEYHREYILQLRNGRNVNSGYCKKSAVTGHTSSSGRTMSTLNSKKRVMGGQQTTQKLGKRQIPYNNINGKSLDYFV